MPWKIGLTVLGVLLLVALSTWLWSRIDRAEQYDRCLSALRPDARPRSPRDLGDLAKACPKPIPDDRLTALESRACDAALTATPPSLYAVRATCSAGVKRLQARAEADRRALVGVTAELTLERAGGRAAINRAAAAATQLERRKSHAALVLATAPRGSDGLIVCDAACLRARSVGPDSEP